MGKPSLLGRKSLKCADSLLKVYACEFSHNFQYVKAFSINEVVGHLIHTFKENCQSKLEIQNIWWKNGKVIYV